MREIFYTISNFVDWYMLSFILSLSLFAHVLLKLFFNLLSTQGKIPFDKWSMMDFLTGALNVIGIFVLKDL